MTNHILCYPNACPDIPIFLQDASMERRYHRNGLRPHKKNVTNITWSTLRVTPFINAVVSCLFLIALIIACFVAFPSNANYQFSNRIGFYISLILIVIFNIIFVVPLIIDFVLLSSISRSFANFYRIFFNWYLRNLYGVIILGMPSVLVLCHFDQCLFSERHYGYRLALGIMLIFMLGNCTLFTIYSSWTKSCVATIIVLIAIEVLFKYRSFHQANTNATAVCGSFSYLQSYNSDLTPFLVNVNSSSKVPIWMMGNRFIDIEIVICLLLTLIFIWYLNRELDISFRASFNCDHQATMARRIMAQERKQADWLLENIIPSFVIEDIKLTKKYSKHMERVGVIFATIANFGDFYDEQFEGGREMLRVLNEIFADFENLLPNPKYKDVQKIKTIGACFMAASGLNPIERERNRKPDSHLYALMDFSMDLIETLAAFNEQLFNFNFELKIGFNIGDVTAGVIGTTKLLYDIWGDTVNVASRMYSTGEKGRIQVTEGVARQLEGRYDFTYRAEVEVKGKGKMTTYLLVGKKGAKRDNPSPLKQ